MKSKNLKLSVLSITLLSMLRLTGRFIREKLVVIRKYSLEMYAELASFDYTKKNIKELLLRKACLFFGVSMNDIIEKRKTIIKKFGRKRRKNKSAKKEIQAGRLIKSLGMIKKRDKIKAINYYRPPK